MNIGDKVKLTKKAVKRFYGTNHHFAMYFTYDPTLRELKSCINSIPFNQGTIYGEVVGQGYQAGTLKVKYVGFLEEEDYSYFDREDLQKVRK